MSDLLVVMKQAPMGKTDKTLIFKALFHWVMQQLESLPFNRSNELQRWQRF